MHALIVFLVCGGTFGVLTAGFIIVSDVMSEEASARRRIRRFPLVRLSDARPGAARITGRVIAFADPLRAPLSGRPCTYYEVSLLLKYVSAQDPRRRGTAASPTTFKVRAGSAFEVDDGTGRALVTWPPPRVRVEGRTPEMHVYTSIPASYNLVGRDATMPEALWQLAADAGAFRPLPVSIEGDEAIIADGDLVTVGGQLAHEIRAEAPADSYRAARLRPILAGAPLIVVKPRGDKYEPSR